MAQRNLDAQHSEVITVECKAVQEKKKLSHKTQTHPLIFRAHLIGSCLGQRSASLHNKETHQTYPNTLVSF